MMQSSVRLDCERITGAGPPSMRDRSNAENGPNVLAEDHALLVFAEVRVGHVSELPCLAEYRVIGTEDGAFDAGHSYEIFDLATTVTRS